MVTSGYFDPSHFFEYLWWVDPFYADCDCVVLADCVNVLVVIACNCLYVWVNVVCLIIAVVQCRTVGSCTYCCVEALICCFLVELSVRRPSDLWQLGDSGGIFCRRLTLLVGSSTSSMTMRGTKRQEKEAKSSSQPQKSEETASTSKVMIELLLEQQKTHQEQQCMLMSVLEQQMDELTQHRRDMSELRAGQEEKPLASRNLRYRGWVPTTTWCTSWPRLRGLHGNRSDQKRSGWPS